MPLQVFVTQKMIGVFVVSPAGSLDSNTYQTLEKKVDELIKLSPEMIVFDLEKLEYISSMGVRVIAKTKKELKKNNGKIILMHLQPPVKKVFDIIKALPTQQIFSSVTELDAYLDQMQKRASS